MASFLPHGHGICISIDNFSCDETFKESSFFLIVVVEKKELFFCQRRKIMGSINLSVTSPALDKIHEFLQDRQPTPVGVRIFVYQDVNGINHSMNFAEDISPADQVFDIEGVTFITDSHSAIFLNDMVLDFITMGETSGFVFQSGCSGKSCFNCRGACQTKHGY